MIRQVLAGVVLALLVPLPAVVAASSPSPNPLCTGGRCAPAISGWLHTNPGSVQVYDSSGNPVPLLGINDDGLDFGTGNPSTSPDSCGRGYSLPPASFTDIPGWGFNFIRVPITWENLEPIAPSLASNGTWIHHWNTAYLSVLDNVATKFGQSHVPVVWDFAQVDVSGAFQDAPEKVQNGECEGWGNPTWLYPVVTKPTNNSQLAAALCDFFNDNSRVGGKAPAPIEGMVAAETMLASRYANNPAVIGIDMFNEPWFGSSCGTVKAEASLMTSFYTKMGSAIEAANPHLLVAFEEPPPGLMPQSPIMTSPPPVPNAIYSVHVYTSSWNDAQPTLEAFVANAGKWGVPAWLGEFNDFYAGCTGPNCTSILDPNWHADSDTLLSYCSANQVNWSFFSFYSLGTSVATPVAKSDILAQLRGNLPLSPLPSTSTSTTTTSSPRHTSSSSTVPEFESSSLLLTLLVSVAALAVVARRRGRR